MRFLSFIFLLLLIGACTEATPENEVASDPELSINHENIIRKANEYLTRDVVTVTASVAERSAGGIHDYYSEGRYWWPNPEDPDGRYIRRDGEANPQNFAGHQTALRELSEMVTALTAAYEITGEEKYARRAIDHAVAWFVTPETRMNPSLLYGQAIKGITTGRGIGIIDTLRLINVALSLELLEKAGLLTGAPLAGVRDWFAAYGDWLTQHSYGTDERDNDNNHSTWWGAQVAAFARIADRPDLTKMAEEQFVRQLAIQTATDGGFPEELKRTRPFHYTIYNLEGWATFAELLSLNGEDYWTKTVTTSRPPYTPEKEAADTVLTPRTISLADAMNNALPYFKDTESWPYQTKLEGVPKLHREDFLIFAWWSLNDERYLELWKTLDSRITENYDGLNANLLVWKKIRAGE